MELLGFVDVPTWAMYLVGFSFLLHWYTSGPQRKARNMGLPGPTMKPIVGNGFDMMMSKDNPGRYLINLKKKYGQLVRQVEFRQPSITIFNLDMLKEVMMKQANKFTDRRTLPIRGIMKHCLLDRLGDEWKENRAVITPFFSSGKLKTNMKAVNICSDNMVSHLQQKLLFESKFDPKSFTSCFTLDVICKTGFDLDVDSSRNPDDPFVLHARQISQVVPDVKFLIAMLFPPVGALFDWLGITMFPKHYLEFFTKSTLDAIRNRVNSTQRRHDFVEAMIRAHEVEIDPETNEKLVEMSDSHTEGNKRKGLTEEEIIANGILLFAAGMDTTSTTLAFLLFALAHHREWQERCSDEVHTVVGQGDVEYEHVTKLTTTHMCMNESLRMFPIAFFVDRVAKEDVTIAGQVIPKGTSCINPIYASHFDEELWSNPEMFDPERFTPENSIGRHPCAFTPFGMGPRNCIGMRLAMIEIKVAVAKILQNFNILPVDGSNFPPDVAPRTFLPQFKDTLWIRLEKKY